MDDEEKKKFLENWRESLKATRDYFSRSNETQLERDAVIDFLANFGISFDEKEVVSVKDDPPDVLFRNATFEVKEKLDQDRRRGDEYRQLLEKAEASDEPNDAVVLFTPKELTPMEVGQIVLNKLDELELKYEPKFKKTLDLLIYVNLLEHFHKPGEMPSHTLFSAYGWRSVCAVSSTYSYVFFASNDAPDFIKALVGQERKRQIES
jgi:hypothetical protein